MAKKYYADLNRRYKSVVDDWAMCQSLMKSMGGLNFKSFTSFDEARAYLTGSSDPYAPGAKSTASNGAGKIPEKSDNIIGCDEVGKVEPFKQLMSVAVYADPAVRRLIKTGDSKKNSGNKEAILALGRELTDFESFDDVGDEVYINEEFGLIYYIKIIPNETYNYWEAQGTEKKRYGNSLLSAAHNEALYRVYEKAVELGKKVDYFVIDDYISTARNHGEQFGVYTAEIDPTAKRINDINTVNMYLTNKCEDKYPDTVGAASNIGDYVDQLWQKKCIEQFAADGIDFSSDWFSNFGANAQREIDKVFDLLTRTYGSVDASPIQVKHTKYYKDYMARH